MRIQSNIKSNVTHEPSTRVEQDNKTPFKEVMFRSKGDMHRQTLSNLMDQLKDKGNQLVEKRTAQNLTDYKKLVQKLLQEVVQNGLQLSERQSDPRQWKSKTYKIIEQVDVKLIELTEEVLGSEQNRLNILALVGEIKGMLMNIYT